MDLLSTFLSNFYHCTSLKLINIPVNIVSEEDKYQIWPNNISSPYFQWVDKYKSHNDVQLRRRQLTGM